MSTACPYPPRPPIGDLLDVPDAVLIVDQQGCIACVNPATRALLGDAPQELLGQPLRTLIPTHLRERHAGC